MAGVRCACVGSSLQSVAEGIRRMKILGILIVLAAGVLCSTAAGVEYHVAATGLDELVGTENG